MSHFIRYRQAARDLIANTLPELKECSTHGGRFTLEELKRFSMHAPGVKLAFLGSDEEQKLSGGGAKHRVSIQAVIITRDAPNLPRDEAALNIGEAIINLVQRNPFGLDWAEAADRVRFRNLYNPTLDQQGVALASVEWQASLYMSAPEIIDAPVDPKLYVGFAPNIGPDHVDDYILAEGDDYEF